jgi:hypothetical protein
MSCYWDIYCVDCGVEAGIEGANKRADLMRGLIAHSDALADLGRPYNAEEGFCWDPVLKVDGIDINLEFFYKHKEHKLRPLNEYRQFDTICGTPFFCPQCQKNFKCGSLDHTLNTSETRGHAHVVDHVYHWEKP